MINVLICGICGKMGANLTELLGGDGEARVVCGVDPRGEEISGKISTVVGGKNCEVPVYKSFETVSEKPDVIIDFSSPAALDGELAYAEKFKVPVVIASTGFTAEQLKKIDVTAKKVAIFRTANFSLGINLICDLVKKAAETLGENFDVEIIERHHNRKADAPSGTALMLADSVNSAFETPKPYLNGRSGIVGKRGNEIGIHAVRGGTIVGEHEVSFCGEDEIITIAHSARSKKVFAAGAIAAAKWLAGKGAGLYAMKDMLKEQL